MLIILIQALDILLPCIISRYLMIISDILDIFIVFKYSIKKKISRHNCLAIHIIYGIQLSWCFSERTPVVVYTQKKIVIYMEVKNTCGDE